ncbi:hypothetical protein EI94DRAFT_1172137 [Lactarius quietus]|nr:hypothetical protein EI94DRAFT_1172137 [Lactarius quietus]
MRKLHSVEMSLSGMSLLDVFLRDDAIYFAELSFDRTRRSPLSSFNPSFNPCSAMTLANLAIIFTFYPAPKGFLSTPASCLCSRLVLHLHEVATPHSASESSLELISAIDLTTRIELVTSVDDHSDVIESSR